MTPIVQILTRPLHIAAILTIALIPTAFAADITFDSSDSSMDISIDGKPFATYVWNDPDIPRPYFKQVFAPNGHQVTRPYPTDPVLNKDNDDHATYHPGIWLAFGDINGHDFWRNKAKVRHVEFIDGPSVTESVGRFTVLNRYETNEAEVICEEICTYEIHVTPSGYLLSGYSTFESPTADVAFGDQEEMGFGVRLATALTVKFGSGTILNSEGGRNEEGTWGKKADWCAYDGLLKNQRTGILLVPHPSNFRRAWFHSRDYGLLVANPFGEKAMTGPNDDAISPDNTPVRASEKFTLGFSVLIYGTENADAFPHEQAYTEIFSNIPK